ncbi:MAG: hypothetical protein R3Y09_11750 [Clostridia bacterium]
MFEAGITRKVTSELIIAYLDGAEMENYSVDEILDTVYEKRNFSVYLQNAISKMSDYSKRGTQDRFAKYMEDKINQITARPESLPETDYEQVLAQINIPNKDKIKKWFGVDGDNSTNFITHQDKDRDNAFLICFALEMDYTQALEFFQKVYLDRFFIREAKDCIFHYCLKNNLPFSKAIELLNEVYSKESSNASDFLKETMYMRENISSSDIKEQDIVGIARGCQAIDKIQVRQNCIEEIIELKRILSERISKDENYLESKGQSRGGTVHLYSMLVPEIKKKDKEKLSISHMKKLEKITRMEYIRAYLYSELPKLDDIKNDTLSSERISFHKLRNIFIVLKFFEFWGDSDLDKSNFDNNETFMVDTNAMLEDFGFGQLYYTNPYDLMFILSVELQDAGLKPLEAIQAIIAEVLELEDD